MYGNKRVNGTRQTHQHSYHPYYSSSPHVQSEASSSSQSSDDCRLEILNKQATNLIFYKKLDETWFEEKESYPPTTPVSTSANNTPVGACSAESSSQSPSIQRNEKVKKLESVINVTPATSNSTSSASSLFKYPASSNSSCCALANSRSSSMTSLSSFDAKSTYSSLSSEYTDKLNNGFMTPASYSDIPDSPGEMTQHSSLNKTRTIPQFNELSVLTIDSNQSKSNDITVIERTVLAGTTFNETDIDYDGESVRVYDCEESLGDTASNRSNISCLTFPNEPTADLTFIRSLLSRKSIPPETNNVRPWANCEVQFTPPVKLKPFENQMRFTQVDFEEDFDDRTSQISLPSDLVDDRQLKTPNMNDFGALFNRISSNKNAPVIKKQLFENYQWSTPIRDNQVSQSVVLDESVQGDYHSVNTSQNESNKEEEADSDDLILQEFIDEMLPLAMATENNDTSLYQPNKFQSSRVDTQMVGRILPKIDEVDETDADTTHRVERRASIGGKSKNCVVVQMTKTSMMRVSKAMQNKTQQINGVKENCERKTNLKVNTKPAPPQLTSNSKKPPLLSSNKINSLKTTSLSRAEKKT